MGLVLKCGFIALVTLVTGFAGSKQFRCDYEYYQGAQGWLKVHKIPASWRDARLRCQLEGAVLASPTSVFRKYVMTTLWKDKNMNCAMYTGIHATFSRGDFASIDGIPLSSIPHVWAKDEPDNFEDKEDCLILLPDGTMGDVNCKSTHPYICYKEQTNMVVSSCGTTDPEYTLDARTGHCYKFHRIPRTWSRAHMACMAEGGHLAIINSEAEATVLKELFEKNPGSSMIGNFFKDLVFVGFHDWSEHGEWRTIHGQTLQEAGYMKFANGQPDNATAGEYCGAMYRDALFDDMWCENASAFICEKDPTSLADCSDNQSCGTILKVDVE